MKDDIDHVLAPPAASAPVDAFTASVAVLQRTARTRRYVRGASVALAVCLAAVGGWFARPQPQTIVSETWVRPTLMDSPMTIAQADPHKLEIQAELAETMDETAKFYRQAGDAYLARTDYGEASRCYKLFLKHGGPNVRDLVRGDSWLLCTLKTMNPSED
jgi:hypothetical protein